MTTIQCLSAFEEAFLRSLNSKAKHTNTGRMHAGDVRQSEAARWPIATVTNN
jgi:hypothetical protein